MMIKKNFFVNVIASTILCFVAVTVVLVTLTGGNINVFHYTDDVYYKGKDDANCVSIMINVYWGTEYVSPMLDVLKKRNVKTTFFIGGSWAAKNNELLLRIRDEGHEIANHGYFHKDHKTLSYAENVLEIEKAEKVIEGICGVKTKLFAPPSGSYAKNTLKAAKDLGYEVIMWSKDTIDWRDKDRNLIYKRATTDIKSGDLILMHPTEQTLLAFDDIIMYYINNKLNVVTVSENIAIVT